MNDDIASRVRVLSEVLQERSRQHEKFGEQNLPDGTKENADNMTIASMYRQGCKTRTARGIVTFRDILEEEVYEAFAESDHVRLRSELIQVAAVAVQWIEAIDRRTK